jgi:hypothetical protein
MLTSGGVVSELAIVTVSGAEVALPPAASEAFETSVCDPERPVVFHAKVYGALNLVSFSTPLI